MLGATIIFGLLVVLVTQIGVFAQLLRDWDRGHLSMVETYALISAGLACLFLIVEIAYVLSVTQ